MRLVSVQNKIIALTVGIVLLFAPFLFYYFPNQQKDLLRDQYYKEVSNIATTVALGVNIALEEQSFEGVETSMQHAKSDDRLTFVALVQVDTLDENGSTEKRVFSVFPEDYPFDTAVESTDEVVVNSSGIDTEFLSGEVVVGFSTVTINDAIADFMWRSFLGSLIVSFLAIIIGIIIARSISNPIHRLKLATQRVADGDLDQPVVVKSSDEIGDLSKSFNVMIQKLEQSESELKFQKALVEERNLDMTDSIFYAKKIQESIFPSLREIKERFNDTFVLYMPKDIVSGDFYWMQHVDDSTLISVADCTGHGVPGAFVSLVCSNAMNTAVYGFELKEPAAILDRVNVIIREQFGEDAKGNEMRDGMDVSVIRYIKGENKIEYAGALNPLWIVSPKNPIDNGVEVLPSIEGDQVNLYEVKGNKQPVGRHVKLDLFSNHTVELNEGDSIYLFSDGYADQFGGEKGKKFKTKAFKQLLIDNFDKTHSEQRRILRAKIIEWMGDNEQLDDICVLGVRI